MSIEQLKSINQGRLQRRAKRYGTRVIGKPEGVVTAWVADGWIDGYKAAVADVRKVIKKAGGPEHNVGSDIMSWTEEQP